MMPSRVRVTQAAPPFRSATSFGDWAGYLGRRFRLGAAWVCGGKGLGPLLTHLGSSEGPLADAANFLIRSRVTRGFATTAVDR